MTDVGKRPLVLVRQQKPTLDLRSENSALGGKILVAREKLLINGPGDVRQHARPFHQVLSPYQHYPVTDGILRTMSRGTKC